MAFFGGVDKNRRVLLPGTDIEISLNELDQLYETDRITHRQYVDLQADVHDFLRFAEIQDILNNQGIVAGTFTAVLKEGAMRVEDTFRNISKALKENEQIIRGISEDPTKTPPKGLSSAWEQSKNAMFVGFEAAMAIFIPILSAARVAGMDAAVLADRMGLPSWVGTGLGAVTEAGVTLVNPAAITRSYARFIAAGREAAAAKKIAADLAKVELVAKKAGLEPKAIQTLRMMGLEVEGYRVSGRVIDEIGKSIGEGAVSRAGKTIAAVVDDVAKPTVRVDQNGKIFKETAKVTKEFGILKDGEALEQATKGVAFQLADGRVLYDITGKTHQALLEEALAKKIITPEEAKRLISGFHVEGKFFNRASEAGKAFEAARAERVLTEAAQAEAAKTAAAKGKKVEGPTGGVDLPTAETIKFQTIDDLTEGLSNRNKFEYVMKNFDELVTRQKRNPSQVYDSYLKSRASLTADDIKSLYPGTAFPSEKIMAAFDVSHPVWDDILKRAREFDNTGDMSKLPKLTDDFYDAVALLITTSGLPTEGGRALQVMKQVRGELAKNLETSIRKSTGLAMIERGVDAGYAEFFREMAKVPTADELITQTLNGGAHGGKYLNRLQEFYRNTLLFNPATALRNLLGTTFGVFSAGLELSIGRVLNSNSGPLESITKLGGELGSFFRATNYSLGRNIKLFKGILDEQFLHAELKAGERLGTRMENVTTAIAGKPGKFIRTPGRVLMSTDVVAQRMIYDSIIYTEAEKKAAAMLASGTIKPSQIQDVIAAAIEKPGPGVMDAAFNASKSYTFTKPLGFYAGKARDIAQSGAGFLIFPFFRTPVNLFKFAAERTPLGFLSKTIRDDIAKGGVAREQAMGKLFMGQVYSMMFWNMAMSGVVNPSRMANNKAAELQAQRGIIPRAFNIGGKQIPANNMEPLSTMAVLWADIAQAASYAKDPDDVETLVAAAVWATVAAADDTTWLRVATDVAEAVITAGKQSASPGEFLSRSLSQPAIAVTPPPIVSQLAKAVDPYVRDARGVMERISSRTPFLSKDVPVDYNIFGEPVLRPAAWGGPVAEALLPLIKSGPNDDETLAILQELGVNPPEHSEALMGPRQGKNVLAEPKLTENLGVPIDDLESRQIDFRRGQVKLKGQSLRERVEAWLQDPRFENWSVHDRAAVLQNEINTFHDIAEIGYLTDNSEKFEQLMKIRQQQGDIRRVTDPEKRAAVKEALANAGRELSQRFDPNVLRQRVPEFFPEAIPENLGGGGVQ